MNANTLLRLILSTLVETGTSVTLEYNKEKDCIYYDLNVNLKSHIYLYIYKGKLFADLRYEKEVHIREVSTLLDIYFTWLKDAETRGWGKITLPNPWRKLAILNNYPIPSQFKI